MTTMPRLMQLLAAAALVEPLDRGALLAFMSGETLDGADVFAAATQLLARYVDRDVLERIALTAAAIQ